MQTRLSQPAAVAAPTPPLQLTDDSRPLGGPYLTKMFADIYPGKKLGAALLRKVYVSDKLKNQMPEVERQKMADEMLHSVRTQRFHYEKH